METGRKPAIALSHDELNRVIAFIRNYAEVHAILLLGQIPGLKDRGGQRQGKNGGGTR